MLTKLSWHISRSKSGLSRWLMHHASMYVDNFNDFSYDLEHNGEKALLNRLRQANVRTVFDVGANVGDWSREACQALPSAHIHAFELSESTRQVLARNLAKLPVTIVDAALGSTDGIIEYKDYGTLSTVNSMISTEFHDATKNHVVRSAAVMRGDQYLADHGIEKIDLMKIDVEGAEMLVLQGLNDALKHNRIRVIQFEYGHANADAGQGHLMKDFYRLLEGYGYTVGRLWSEGVCFSPFNYRLNNFDSGPNFVAALRNDGALIDLLRSKV